MDSSCEHGDNLVPVSWSPHAVLCLDCFRKANPNEHIDRTLKTADLCGIEFIADGEKHVLFLRAHFVAAHKEAFFKILTQKLSFEQPIARQMAEKMSRDFVKYVGFDKLDYATNMSPFYWIQATAK